MEVFIHEDYVNKRREQRRRQTMVLQVQTEKWRLPPLAAMRQESPRGEPTAPSPSADVGSPAASTDTASSFGDHLFDYLKPY